MQLSYIIFIQVVRYSSVISIDDRSSSVIAPAHQSVGLSPKTTRGKPLSHPHFLLYESIISFLLVLPVTSGKYGIIQKLQTSQIVPPHTGRKSYTKPKSYILYCLIQHKNIESRRQNFASSRTSTCEMVYYQHQRIKKGEELVHKEDEL